MRWRVIRIAAFVVIPLAAILVFARWPLTQRLTVQAYFTNSMGLRPGAAVRVAGVDVGSVKSVRLRPELKDVPVEVVMTLDPSYDFKIPNDSIAQLHTAGVLGETYVDVNTSSAIAPPLAMNGVIKTRPTVTLSAQQLLEKVTDELRRIDCDFKKNIGCAGQPSPPATKHLPESK